MTKVLKSVELLPDLRFLSSVPWLQGLLLESNYGGDVILTTTVWQGVFGWYFFEFMRIHGSKLEQRCASSVGSDGTGLVLVDRSSDTLVDSAVC